MRLFIRRTPEAPFAGYITEILAIEGILGCETVDLTASPLTPELLDGQALVLVAHMPLPPAEQEALAEYVRGGGRLLALRPPVEMAGVFGLEAVGTTLKRGHYLQLDPDGCPPGARSTDVPLQVHAEADGYRVQDATVAAWFCWGNGARRHLPAAVIHRVGDGMAAMLAFDLAHSTVAYHQGLPEQASTGARPDPGAQGLYRPDSLFIGHLDITRVTIPQADLQQRLLVGLLEALAPAPAPRLWYFPQGAPCLAFLNGDSDNMTLADLEAVLAILEPHGGRFTCYVMNEEPLPPADEAALRARGHHFGKHVWAGPRPSVDEMAAVAREQISGFRARYGYPPLSNRGHCLIWPGWTEMAQILADSGVRLDANFVGAHCGHGYLTGSGLPVKFMDPSGRLIDLYEQSTQWEDDVAIATQFERLTYEQAVALSLETLRESREQYHTVINFNFHPIHTRPDRLNTSAWIRAVADYCATQQIPMIGGDDWVRFNDARRAVQFSGYHADRARRHLRFTLTAPRAVVGLTLALPTSWDDTRVQQATADGAPLALRHGRTHAAETTFFTMSMADATSQTVNVEYSS